MNTKFFDAHSMSISEYVNLLFSATDDDKILSIPRFDEHDLSQGPDYTESFKMKWCDKDLPKAISYCELIAKSVKEIADIKTKNNGNFLKTLEQDDNHYFVWKKYIESLDEEPIDYDELNDLIERMDGGDLTDEEWEYYDKIMTDRQLNAQFRVGGKIRAYEFVIAAQRLYKLYLLSAPEVIINNEIIRLTEAIILNNYGIEEI